jgi:hypothetical protein
MKALNFYVWWSSSISAPPDPAATFNVKIDGNTIFSLTPATAGDYNAGYTLVSVDISTYADGNSHTLRFEGVMLPQPLPRTSISTTSALSKTSPIGFSRTDLTDLECRAQPVTG